MTFRILHRDPGACCPLKRWQGGQLIFFQIFIGNIVFDDLMGVHFPRILIVGFLHARHSAGLKHVSFFYQFIDAFPSPPAPPGTNLRGLPIDESNPGVVYRRIPTVAHGGLEFPSFGSDLLLRTSSCSVASS